MPQKTLTDKSILTLPGPHDGRDRVFYSDKRWPWLKLCVHASGKRTWYAERTRASKTTRIRLDDVRVLNVVQARSTGSGAGRVHRQGCRCHRA